MSSFTQHDDTQDGDKFQWRFFLLDDMSIISGNPITVTQASTRAMSTA
jgi:hypothetical protein